ncbi:saccharopine dehydrogenase NADP-binding domain-containing protein, partial [Actinomyces sp. 186855]|uniref:saccharopine dehydrogenase family protein n=1 Tax=Actinomyces sp. 186855 TaxID=2761164 RepID=UPI002017C96A
MQSEAVSSVTIADVDIKKAERVCQQLYSSKIEAKQVDASNERKLAALMNEHDVVINALFYAFNETVAKTAIQVGVHSVDLGGHIGHITDRILQLHEKAKQAGVTIIPDLGVAPGMINILSGYG